MMNKKIKDILAKKNKSKLVSLTAYSKNIAQIIDKYVDMTLVGDSMASVLYNYNTTRKISLDTMIEHAKSVRMGVIIVLWFLICLIIHIKTKKMLY